MKKVLVIPNQENIEEYLRLAKAYDLGFEYNEFYVPKLLDDRTLLEEVIHKYEEYSLPEYTTMHGAFYDVVPSSPDEKIRQIALQRIQQSLDIARKMGVKAVIFHTGYNPFLNTKEYIEAWLESNSTFWGGVLSQNEDLNIYLENMFEQTPDLLEELAKRLSGYANFGICLDYAHAGLYGGNPSLWAKRLSRFIRHVHINDNDGGSDQHLALGEGKLKRDQFYADYKAYMQGATVLIETSTLPRAVKSLEVLAREGFLKN